MEASKLTISQDTMEKQKLSPRKAGELRWQRLKELAESGELQFASTRQELMKQLGGGQSTVYWVNNLISRGHLIETIDRFENSKARYTYRLSGTEPSYRGEHLARARMNKQEKQVQKIETTLSRGSAEVKLVKGDVVVTAMLDAENIVKVICMLAKMD